MKKTTKKQFLEEDLYRPVCDLLMEQGYTVRSEVRDCDITAVKDDILLVVELKKSLTVNLLVQAVNRQKFADLVYIAIPKPSKLTRTKKWHDICHLIRRLELGLLLVSFRGENAEAEIALQPMLFDRAKSRQMNKKSRHNLLKEIENRHYELNIGGSKGKKLVTAYREGAIFIACCLEEFGPLTPAKLREMGTDEKKTYSILYHNHYDWFEKVDRGVYGLSDKGRDEFKQYTSLVEYYRQKIESLDPSNHII